MRRVAALDCGTNSIRLLIAEENPGASAFTEISRKMSIVKLGEGVDKNKAFLPDAISRTLAALKAFAAEIAEAKVEKVRFCATSATRDAQNRDDFLIPVAQILGITPEVISGDEEAKLSFLGATQALSKSDGPFLVIDIGGGSTEFVFGVEQVEAARSVNIGCVRMSERHFKNDPPNQSEIDSARIDIRNAIAQAAEVVPIKNAKTLVAVAGTATTVAAAALNLAEYDSELIHLAKISAKETRRVSDWLLTLTRQERSDLGYMHPGRVDVIAAGSLVLAEIIEATGLESFVASENDILDGMVWSMLNAQ
ncbi:MAG: exopolyphosphatase [Actinobacteria bacterium]|nr:exopolyphosphatase [Actinomycetota bacterium]